jgi:hypothetical protein
MFLFKHRLLGICYGVVGVWSCWLSCCDEETRHGIVISSIITDRYCVYVYMWLKIIEIGMNEF